MKVARVIVTVLLLIAGIVAALVVQSGTRVQTVTVTAEGGDAMERLKALEWVYERAEKSGLAKQTELKENAVEYRKVYPGALDASAKIEDDTSLPLAAYVKAWNENKNNQLLARTEKERLEKSKNEMLLQNLKNIRDRLSGEGGEGLEEISQGNTTESPEGGQIVTEAESDSDDDSDETLLSMSGNLLEGMKQNLQDNLPEELANRFETLRDDIIVLGSSLRDIMAKSARETRLKLEESFGKEMELTRNKLQETGKRLEEKLQQFQAELKESSSELKLELQERSERLESVLIEWLDRKIQELEERDVSASALAQTRLDIDWDVRKVNLWQIVPTSARWVLLGFALALVFNMAWAVFFDLKPGKQKA